MPVGKQRFSDFSPSIKSEKMQNTAALQNVAVIRNAQFACVLECGGASPPWDRVSLHNRDEFVAHAQPIGLKPINRSHHWRRRDVFKPSRRTPPILIRHWHQAMLNRILMDIVQPSKIRLLIGKFRIPEIMPDSPRGCAIQPTVCV